MNYQHLSDDALLRGSDVYLPNGPVPLRRSAWYARVQAGEAPRPIRISQRATAWRWADVRAYLQRLAQANG